MRELPRPIAIEELRRLIRERQTLCIECGEIVEGVDKFSAPQAFANAFNVECMRCGCDYVYGVCELVQRAYLERPEPSAERMGLEERVWEGMPGGFEGRDEFHYVWVDGEYENVQAMTDERLVAMAWRLSRMKPEHREQVVARIRELEVSS